MSVLKPVIDVLGLDEYRKLLTRTIASGTLR